MIKNNVEKGILSLFIISLLLSSSYVTIGKEVNIQNESDDSFDNRIEELMAHGHFPGLSVCIVKNNKMVWAKGYGYADLRPLQKRKPTAETVYPIASVSKSFAATAIMQIVENESYDFNLDGDVSRYLPFDLKNPKYPDVNITSRMLLAHQSSMKNLGVFHSVYCNLLKNPINWLKYHFKKPNSWFDYAPGENVFYTTLDINLLGYIVQNVTKQSYADYCQEHIFKPLKMNKTSFSFSNYNKNECSRRYVWGVGFYFIAPNIEVSEIMYPGGGAISTVSDLSHYLIMHANGGVYDGIRILSEKSVEEMHRAQYPDSLDRGHHHGLGWYFKTYPDGEIYGGHGGTHPGVFSIMKMRYSDKVGVICIRNQNFYLTSAFKCRRSEEKEAAKEIINALFDKADEL
jgi:CubicO group peptidase (beta-lactamase class C family)